jgi:hypothetical protein
MFNLAQHVQEIRRLTADQIVRPQPPATVQEDALSDDHHDQSTPAQQQPVAAETGGVPLWMWAAGGAIVVGAAAWWFWGRSTDHTPAGRHSKNGRKQPLAIHAPAPALHGFTTTRAQPIPIEDEEEEELHRRRPSNSNPERQILDRITPRVHFNDQVEEHIIPPRQEAPQMPLIQIDRDSMLG